MYAWIDERLNVTPLWKSFANHEVPEHVNPAHHISAFVYCFGGITFLLIVLQFISGAFLALSYVPDIENAWKSVYYIQNDVAFGQIVRAIHHWGSSLTLVMLFLHMLRVYIHGAYKKPRELNWIVGVLLFLIVLAFSLTGYLLPWDMKALNATNVTLEIAQSMPIVGDYLTALMSGGGTVGAVTLTRFFALHVFFLPAALIGLVVMHFIMIRKQGISGPL